MKPIATNIADFEVLRREGLLYVDKTAYLHRLITTPGSTFFFCARPRRFGKSLSVTTLKSIFLGHREFFDGLAITKTDYDWRPHAVVHFNWGGVDVSSIETFEETFTDAVRDALVAGGYAYDADCRPSTNLARAIDYFYRKDGIGPAILIDEYDDPVAKALADVDLAAKIRTRLSAIYAQFKDNSGEDPLPLHHGRLEGHEALGLLGALQPERRLLRDGLRRALRLHGGGAGRELRGAVPRAGPSNHRHRPRVRLEDAPARRRRRRKSAVNV